jgi:hypothetical protein
MAFPNGSTKCAQFDVLDLEADLEPESVVLWVV